MLKIGDRVRVINSSEPVLKGRTGIVVDNYPTGYSGCVTVQFDSPMPFEDLHTRSRFLRHMRHELLSFIDDPQPVVTIEFSFDSLIGEQHE